VVHAPSLDASAFESRDVSCPDPARTQAYGNELRGTDTAWCGAVEALRRKTRALNRQDGGSPSSMLVDSDRFPCKRSEHNASGPSIARSTCTSSNTPEDKIFAAAGPGKGAARARAGYTISQHPLTRKINV